MRIVYFIILYTFVCNCAKNQGLTNSLNNFAPAYSSVSTYAVDSLVTYNGKFYKCIVGVTTPEQFDINKWDDVTTSEVYAIKGLRFYRQNVANIVGTNITNASSWIKTNNDLAWYFITAQFDQLDSIELTDLLPSNPLVVAAVINNAYAPVLYNNKTHKFDFSGVTNSTITLFFMCFVNNN